MFNCTDDNLVFERNIEGLLNFLKFCVTYLTVCYNRKTSRMTYTEKIYHE